MIVGGSLLKETICYAGAHLMSSIRKRASVIHLWQGELIRNMPGLEWTLF